MHYSDIIKGDNYDHINITFLHSQKCFPLFFTCTFNKTAVFNFHGISIALKPQVTLPIQQIISIKIFFKKLHEHKSNCDRPKHNKQYHRPLSARSFIIHLGHSSPSHSAYAVLCSGLHTPYTGSQALLLFFLPKHKGGLWQQHKHNSKGGGYFVGHSFWFYPLMSLILDFVNRVHVAQMPTLTDAHRKMTQKKERKKKMKRSCCSNECTRQQCSGILPQCHTGHNAVYCIQTFHKHWRQILLVNNMNTSKF